MLMAGEMAQLRFDPKSEGTYPFAGDEHKVELLLTAMVNQAVAELNLTTEDARYEFVSQLERRCQLAAQREATDIVDRQCDATIAVIGPKQLTETQSYVSLN